MTHFQLIHMKLTSIVLYVSLNICAHQTLSSQVHVQNEVWHYLLEVQKSSTVVLDCAFPEEKKIR